MKVLILTPRISPARSLYYNALSNYVDLTVITERKTSNKNILLGAGVKYINLLTIQFKEYMGIPLNLFVIFKYFNHKIIVEQYSSPSGMLAIMLFYFFNKSFIINADGGFVNYAESYLLYRIKSFLLTRSSIVLSSGNNCDEYLKHYKVEQNKIKRFPLSSYSIKDVTKISSIPIPKNKYRYLFIGQFIKRKGIDLIIQVARNFLENLEFVLVGGKESDLSWFKGEIPNNVLILPYKDRESLFEIIDSSDCVIIASYEDIWNYVLMESYSRGKRVISSDKSASSIDYIYESSNQIFKSGDTIDLIAKINYSLEAIPTESEIMYYHEISSIFTVENMARTIYEVIQSAKP
jgi:glycosyltransferase involved in cell wall biosynthesis